MDDLGDKIRGTVPNGKCNWFRQNFTLFKIGIHSWNV
jgi:hypothetical protein